MYRVWQQHIKKPLSEAELKVVTDQVALEVKQIQDDVRQAHELKKQNRAVIEPELSRQFTKIAKKPQVPFTKRFAGALLKKVQK